MLDSLVQDTALRNAINVMDAYPWKRYWKSFKFQIQFGQKMRESFKLESLMHLMLQMMKMAEHIQKTWKNSASVQLPIIVFCFNVQNL